MLIALCIQRQSSAAVIPNVALMHRRASAWLAAQGLLDEAIGHALGAADFDTAARLIRRAASPLLARGETQTLRTWLRALQVLLAPPVTEEWVTILTTI